MRILSWRGAAIFSALFFASASAVVACGGNGDSSPSGSGGKGTGGSASDGGGGPGGAGGSATGGGGSAATGGGATGQGGGGAPAFGPCHGYTDDFESFDPAAPNDYWEVDGVVTSDGAAGSRDVLAAPDAELFAGLFSSKPKVSTNCFTSVAVKGAQGPGFYVLQVLEGNDSGRMLDIEVTPGMAIAEDITDGTGNGMVLGMASLNGDLTGLRIQLLDGSVVFEVRDDDGFKQIATTTSPPSWVSHPVKLSFGYREDQTGETTRFDDFGLDAP